MPLKCYDPTALARLKKNQERMAMVTVVNRVIRNYQAQGFQLTLRQLYYQMVAHDLFPNDRKFRWTGSGYVRDENGTKNADPNYKWLGDLLTDSRMAGLTDWTAIIDRTRNLEALPHWDGPPDILDAVAKQFNIDRWATQPTRVEVWIEKDALVGVIENVCKRWDVPYFSCRGYTSISEVWEASQRLLRYQNGHTGQRQEVVILHFGDHDPSGIDMTRDIRDRLHTFGVRRLDLRRMALNMNQVEQYNPPPNPAKLTDSRCKGYMEIHGDESWELDALDPPVIEALIDREIKGVIEPDPWAEATDLQMKGRAQLAAIAGRYDEIEETIGDVDFDTFDHSDLAVDDDADDDDEK